MNDAAPSYDSQFDLPERRSDRRVTIAHRLEYAVIAGLMGLFRLLGLDRASALAGGFTRFVGPKLRPISKRGEDNLRLIFPDWEDEKIRRTLAEVWENLGRTAAEYAHLEKLRAVGENPRIVCEGGEKVIQAVQAHGRAVFVTGHFANWEVTGIVAHEMQLRFGVIYRALNNPLIDEMIIKKRGAVMTRRQIPKGVAGARPLIELLKDRYSIAFLSDQKLNLGGIPVPFMGHTAMTSPAAARLAVRFGLPVIPIASQRLKGSRFRVAVRDPIPFEPTGDLRADVEAMTIKINEALEREIRAHPGQWLWLHRRWPKDAKVKS